MEIASVIKWVMVVLMGITMIGKVILIGQPRPPYTKGEAVFSLLWNGLFIWLILTYL